MRRLITLDISPATATHCDTHDDSECPHYDRYEFGGAGHCDVFGTGDNPPQWDNEHRAHKRLPECIAAEQNAAQKGGSQ